MDTLPALSGYDVQVTPLKGRSTRVDVAVTHADALPAPFTDTDIIGHLRLFFDKLEAEAAQRKDDPVAMTNALARLEALLADVRYVRDTVRGHAAAALHEHGIRKLTVEHVATVEGTSTSERTWLHEKAMRLVVDDALYGDDPDRRWIDAESGEFLRAERIVEAVLDCAAIAYWRSSALREHGIDPKHVSEQPEGEDGKPLREPAVRIHDNRIRRING